MEKAVSGISNLSLNELKELVDVLIEEKLSQFLGDPDSGLELNSTVARRILKKLNWLKENFDLIIPEPLSGEFKGLYKLYELIVKYKQVLHQKCCVV